MYPSEDRPGGAARQTEHVGPLVERGKATYVAQISAQRTEAEAQSSYRALEQKYPAVLGSREANFRRVDLGDTPRDPT